MARQPKEITFSTPIVARDMAAAEHFHQHRGQEVIDGVGLLLMMHSWDVEGVGAVEVRPLIRCLQQRINDRVAEERERGVNMTPRQAVDAIWGIDAVLERFKAIPMSSGASTGSGTIKVGSLLAMVDSLVNGDTVH